MRTIIAAITLLATASIIACGTTEEKNMDQNSFHKFNILQLDEEATINMADFQGKKILVVNVASECGFTVQYGDLQKLYEQYKESLVIIGFPCNQFGGQEPGSKEEIATFCQKNYGVTFPISQKIDVKGENQHAIYSWLTSKTQNGLGDYEVAWNFNKFLIDEDGQLISYFPSKVKPFDSKLINAIES